jgi:hypothetical protein
MNKKVLDFVLKNLSWSEQVDGVLLQKHLNSINSMAPHFKAFGAILIILDV